MTPPNLWSADACPKCDSTDIRRTAHETEERGRIERDMACYNCGAAWTTTYEWAGYENITGGKDDKR